MAEHNNNVVGAYVVLKHGTEGDPALVAEDKPTHMTHHDSVTPTTHSLGGAAMQHATHRSASTCRQSKHAAWRSRDVAMCKSTTTSLCSTKCRRE